MLGIKTDVGKKLADAMQQFSEAAKGFATVYRQAIPMLKLPRQKTLSLPAPPQHQR